MLILLFCLVIKEFLFSSLRAKACAHTSLMSKVQPMMPVGDSNRGLHTQDSDALTLQPRSWQKCLNKPELTPDIL